MIHRVVANLLCMLQELCKINFRYLVMYGLLYKRPLVWGPRSNARLYRSGQTVTEPLKPRKVA